MGSISAADVSQLSIATVAEGGETGLVVGSSISRGRSSSTGCGDSDAEATISGTDGLESALLSAFGDVATAAGRMLVSSFCCSHGGGGTDLGDVEGKVGGGS